MRLLKLAVLAAILSATALCGCATDCGDVLMQWDYACRRNYELCTIQGHDEAYCRQVIENCWMDSSHARANCSPPPEVSQAPANAQP
jgi:hypothetical protein